jgi:orotate phosphoribosyltransferase
MGNDLTVLPRAPACPTPSPKVQAPCATERLRAIIRQKSYRSGQAIRLTSGKTSTFYINLKPTMMDPEGAALLAKLVLAEARAVGAELVGGLEMGAVPIVSAVAAESYRSANGGGRIAGFFVRKKPKEHGVQALIEGLDDSQSLDGRRVMIVEDVTTTGGSICRPSRRPAPPAPRSPAC